MPETNKPRLDTTINYGHILTALSMFVSVMYVGITGVVSNAELKREVSGIQTALQVHGPMLTALETTSQLNTERLTNLVQSVRANREEFVSSVQDLRRVDSETRTEVNSNRVSIAALQAAQARTN